jgi:hypothetical protein
MNSGPFLKRQIYRTIPAPRVISCNLRNSFGRLNFLLYTSTILSLVLRLSS